jgi:hypothetical protein
LAHNTAERKRAAVPIVTQDILAGDAEGELAIRNPYSGCTQDVGNLAENSKVASFI